MFLGSIIIILAAKYDLGSQSNHNRASICCVRRISLVLKAENRLGTGHVPVGMCLLRYSADADADMRD